MSWAVPRYIRRDQVWCGGVTYLPNRVRGQFFYLYAVIDLFNRKLVAWEVHERRESLQDFDALVSKIRLRKPMPLAISSGGTVCLR